MAEVEFGAQGGGSYWGEGGGAVPTLILAAVLLAPYGPFPRAARFSRTIETVTHTAHAMPAAYRPPITHKTAISCRPKRTSIATAILLCDSARRVLVKTARISDRLTGAGLRAPCPTRDESR